MVALAHGILNKYETVSDLGADNTHYPQSVKCETVAYSAKHIKGATIVGVAGVRRR